MFWHKATLLILRIAIGMAILVAFATLMGVGIGRQIAIGGGFEDEARETLTQNAFVVWLKSGGVVAGFALAGAWLDRKLSQRWGMA
ncbi:MAG: hypothetical protein ACRBBU_09265 [Pseudooceanicola sp.]